jgi:hypothetical protein
MLFANTLRAQPGAIVLADGADAITIRVQAAEAWDAVRVTCSPSASIAEVKRAAMQVLLPDVQATDDYCVKLRGVLVEQEAVSLAQAGVRAASTLFVTARRRRPIL